MATPSSLSSEFRQDEADGLCRAGRGRDDVERRGARPVEVLVHLIERGLVVGVGMHRGHETLVDADCVVEHLDDRREAIGRARGVGDDGVRLGELVVIDAVNHGEVDAVGWRRDQHALGAGLQMGGSFFLRRENAGAFQCDVDAEFLPRQLRGVLHGSDPDRAIAAGNGVALDRDFAGKAAVHGVETQKVRIGLDRRQVVYGDDFDIVAVGFDDGTQNIAADAAKPVDGNANRHIPVSLRRRREPPGSTFYYVIIVPRLS